MNRKGSFLLFVADTHDCNNEWTEFCNTGFLSIYASKDMDLRLLEIKSQGKIMSEDIKISWLEFTLDFQD